MLHLVGCLYYLHQWCTVKQISDNEIYLLVKYIKSVLWRVANCLSYIEEAQCLKVNFLEPSGPLQACNGTALPFTVKHSFFNVYITKMFFHDLSQQYVSALSRAIFGLKTFLSEVNRTIDNLMILLSTRSRVTSIKFIYLKSITVIVKLKCYHNIKYI